MSEEPRLYHIPMKIKWGDKPEIISTMAVFLTPSQFEERMKQIHWKEND